MLSALKKLASRVTAEVKAAREPAPASAHDDGIELPEYAIHTPGTHEAIVLPQPRLFKRPPTPDEQRAEGRRIALEYARARSGKRELTWKQAKLLLERWETEERRDEQHAKRAVAPANPKTIEVVKR